MGRASKRCARERMVFQEVRAKTTARIRSRIKVRRQSSFWRFSNCSRREDIVERFAPVGEEPLAGPSGSFPRACIKVRDDWRKGPRIRRRLAESIVGRVTGIRQVFDEYLAPFANRRVL